MKKLPFLLPALIVFSIFFISCKKQSSSTPSVQCRISNIQFNNSIDNIIRFEYDSAKRLISIIDTPIYSKKSFVYSGNFIFETSVGESGTVYRIDTVSLKPSGKIATVIDHLIGDLPLIDSMTYDSNDQLTKLVEINGPDRSEATYTWNNGDAISRNGQNFLSSISFSYYTDKNATESDFYNLQELLNWGAHALGSKHLMKQDLDGNISYTFDADRKIITATIDNGAPKNIVYTYSYICD